MSMEADCLVGHQTLALCRPHRLAKIGLPREAELALPTLGRVEEDDVIADLDVVDILPDRFNDARALVAQHNREHALWVFARPSETVRLAHSGVLDLDSDLISLGRIDSDRFELGLFPRPPGDGGGALDWFASG